MERFTIHEIKSNLFLVYDDYNQILIGTAETKEIAAELKHRMIELCKNGNQSVNYKKLKRKS